MMKDLNANNQQDTLTVFENDDFGAVRTVLRDGEPWFVASDVCKALEISDVHVSLRRLDDDEKDGCLIPTPGGEQQMSIVNEPGLYSLVLGSRKPEAKAFKRWITHEVIPAIRRTGQYSTSRQDEKLRLQQARTEAMLRNAKSREAELWAKFAGMLENPEHKQLCASYGTQVLTGGERVLPLPEIEKTYSAEEVGRMWGISAQMVGRIANQNGLKTKQYGKLVLDKSRYSSKEVETWRYNQRGAEAIGEYLS